MWRVEFISDDNCNVLDEEGGIMYENIPWFKADQLVRARTAFINELERILR
jgi:hypothetical protein